MRAALAARMGSDASHWGGLAGGGVRMGHRLILTLILVATCCPRTGADETAAWFAKLADHPWVPGQIIVGFEEGSDIDGSRVQRYEPRVRGSRGLRHGAVAKNGVGPSHPLARVRVLKLGRGADVLDVAETVRRIPGVAYAHPNYFVVPAYDPDDSLFATEQYASAVIRAPEAWDITVGRSGVLVAVIDSGIRLDHEDLQNGAIWVNDDPVNGIDDDRNGFVDDVNGWDFINNDQYPWDADGHGTHVAGIIAARTGNAIGIAGLAQVTIMPIQVFDGPHGTWEALAQAIFYAVDNGADVINFSGGGFGGDGLLERAVEYAWQNNVAVITAAGNHGTDDVIYPAAYPQSITVGATGPDDGAEVWSATGPHVDVAAPGVSILSTYARYADDYQTSTGTSMAAAHVTGLVALMVTVNPDLGVEQVRRLLQDNAVDVADRGFDESTGAGRIDAAATLASVPRDIVTPRVVHDQGRNTFPYSGYIDPRSDSSSGDAVDYGIDTLIITFSEPVRDAGAAAGQPLSANAFSVTGTSDALPTVAAIDASDNPTVYVYLSASLPVGQWTTIVANVEDLSGNRIEPHGNLGPDRDEPDRVDLGFLPGDVDQNGNVDPLDLLRLKRMIFGQFDAISGDVFDYADLNRDGKVDPVDVLEFRKMVRGQRPATQRWAGQRLPDRP